MSRTGGSSGTEIKSEDKNGLAYSKYPQENVMIGHIWSLLNFLFDKLNVQKCPFVKLIIQISDFQKYIQSNVQKYVCKYIKI